MKQPRKVALINVADYPREKYSAYWQISVQGSDEEGYRWEARLLSYTPVGYEWDGKRYDAWPEGVAKPDYPEGPTTTKAEFLSMDRAGKRATIAAEEAHRQRCAEIYEGHPKPVYVIKERMGVTDTRDEADTAAQEWVLGRISAYVRPGAGTVRGYALPLPLDLVPWSRLARALGRLLAPWLMALAFATGLRNNRANQIRDAIDAGAGAGLLRIYDGSRPASCGTATTLGAELTFSDPSAPGASGGVMTASAITDDSSANATITATWFRVVDSTGTCVMDGNVGTASSDLNLNSTSIASGQRVSCTSFVITEGNP